MHLIPILLALALLPGLRTEAAAQASRPNILLVITDDQSHPHASAYGSHFVETPYLHLAVARQPAEKLYDLRTDPDCLHNLAAAPTYAAVTGEHRERLQSLLLATGDPRVLGNGDVWESCERLEGPMRRFPTPEWALP